MKIKDKIKNKLDEYMGFDSDKIFQQGDMIRIFGGSIRDIIANMKINDIDIICGSKSAKSLHCFLESTGYQYVESLTPKDLSSVYTDTHIINEPHTYIKDGKSIIQVIRPTIHYYTSSDKKSVYTESINNLINEVDISCCGVSYDGYNLIENIPQAVDHCRCKVYQVLETKMNVPNRLIHRREKMKSRGWEEIDGIEMNREFKLNNIMMEEDGINYEYVKTERPIIEKTTPTFDELFGI